MKVRLLEGIGDAPQFMLAGFVTHATQMPGDGGRARELYAKWAANCVRTFDEVCGEKRIVYQGYFHCKGAPSPGIETFIHDQIVTDEDEWAAYITDVRTHPDEIDLREARAFAGRVLEAC